MSCLLLSGHMQCKTAINVTTQKNVNLLKTLVCVRMHVRARVCVCVCVCDLIEQFFPVNFVIKDSIILQCQKVGQPYLFRKMCNILWNFTFFGACIYSLGLAGKYKDIKSEI